MKNLLGLREIISTLINKLTLTAQNVGFTISGGTTSKTLTILGDYTISGKAGNSIVCKLTSTANVTVPATGTVGYIIFNTSIADTGFSLNTSTGETTLADIGKYKITFNTSMKEQSAIADTYTYEGVCSGSAGALFSAFTDIAASGRGMYSSSTIFNTTTANETIKISISRIGSVSGAVRNFSSACILIIERM